MIKAKNEFRQQTSNNGSQNRLTQGALVSICFVFNKAVSKSTFKRKSYKHPIRCNSLMITESVNVEPVEFEKVLNQVFSEVQRYSDIPASLNLKEREYSFR